MSWSANRKIMVGRCCQIVIEAVFFDLDGTLLPIDMDEFLPQYFKAITYKFREVIPPDLMKESILNATLAMAKNNNPAQTNQEVFMEHFMPRVSHFSQDLLPIFNSFYNHEFKNLKAFARPDPAAKKVVDKLAGRGYRLVLATNPIFPREAILERMRWAGVESAPWELITSFEECHFCKPNPGYFNEILSKMRLSGEQALMVGNDTVQDLIASTLGLKTYLATDNLIDRGNSPWEPDFRGKLVELPTWLENTPW